MNYYQHHIGDFIRDTARLSNDQCMAYLRLIWMYYETEQPLENDADALAFRIGANASDVHQILRHFFFEHEGMWHHARCDKEILTFREKSEKAKKSADARWKNADAMRTHSERNANATVFDANQEPITNMSTTDVVDMAPPSPEPKPKEKKRKSKMPDDFEPNETGIRYAAERHVSVAEEIQRMRNWAESNGVLRLDWQATWRTWCDKAVEFGRAGKPPARAQRPEKFDPIRYVNDPAYAAECDRKGQGTPPAEGDSHGRVIDAQSQRLA